MCPNKIFSGLIQPISHACGMQDTPLAFAQRALAFKSSIVHRQQPTVAASPIGGNFSWDGCVLKRDLTTKVLQAVTFHATMRGKM